MSFTQKAAAAAGSLAALSIASQDAEATIVHVDNMPLTINFNNANGTEIDWDVDGQFGRDFYLQRENSFIDLDSSGANGSGFVNPIGAALDDFQNLPTGFIVGPTLAAGYFFGISNANNRTLLANTTPASIYIATEAIGFSSGVPGFVGFAFDAGGTTLYGWAELTITDSGPGTATISEWAYEDSGAAIAVGDTESAAIPEPHALAMIAMGAAGVAAWRSRRKKQAVTKTQEP